MPVAEPPERTPLAWLHIRAEGRPSVPLAVPSTAASIGADPDNDIVLRDAGLAPRHGQFRLRGGIWTFTNLCQDLPLWIDGEHVLDEEVLAPGSILCLGDATLAFSPEDSWDDSPRPLTEPIRPPLMVIPEAEWSTWPTVIFALALGAVIFAAIMLMRAH
jgi:hypothetical protein